MELSNEFLMELRKSAYHRWFDEDAVNHIAKVLEMVDLIYVPGVDSHQIRMKVFPLSLADDTQQWWIYEKEGKITVWEELVEFFFYKCYPESYDGEEEMLDEGDNWGIDPLEFISRMDDKILSSNNTTTESFFKPYLITRGKCDTKKENEQSQTKRKYCNASESIDDQPNKRMCKVEKFEAIQYSLGPNEEYIAIRRLITEYLVNISKRRAFWSLNEDILKITILKTNTPYPSRKIRQIEYFSANSGFSDDDESKNITGISDEEFNLKQTSPRKTTTHYIESYIPPILFPRRLEQHANEALIHKTMESLKKIKSNQPFLKEIRQSNEYPKYMKDLEKDPGSFILPCSIGRLDFNNALANLGASISIMPFSVYKRLGIGNLETIKMNIELANNSKCIPKGIVRNLLIKIDKFILPIDFIILDILEDFRMPVILGRPLLATARAKVDVLKKSISLEVGNEKVIFKMKSDLPNMQNESILMIQSNMITKEDELMNLESDLFTYITNTCESCHLLAINTDLFTYEVVTHETYEEIDYKSCLTAHEAIGENTKPILVDEMMKNKILTEHWRKQFRVDYDDSDDFYVPDQCGEGRNNEIRERIINNLHKEWFKGMSDDEDDIEGIVDYLEPTSYEGFIDLDDEEYNKI
ncbi:zinc knuckle CX2CX4HX4C containing protein [Tanacetum coccineum]